MAALLTNALARPDFVAYSVERMHDATIRMHRRVFRTPLAVWTVRSRKDLRGILARGESAIFEAGAGEDPIQTEDLP